MAHFLNEPAHALCLHGLSQFKKWRAQLDQSAPASTFCAEKRVGLSTYQYRALRLTGINTLRRFCCRLAELQLIKNAYFPFTYLSLGYTTLFTSTIKRNFVWKAFRKTPAHHPQDYAGIYIHISCYDKEPYLARETHSYMPCFFLRELQKQRIGFCVKPQTAANLHFFESTLY